MNAQDNYSKQHKSVPALLGSKFLRHQNGKEHKNLFIERRTIFNMAPNQFEPSKIRPPAALRKRVLPLHHRLEISRIRSVQVDISKITEDVHKDHDHPIRQVKVQTFMSQTISTFILRQDAAAHLRSGMKQILALIAEILALSATKAAAAIKTDPGIKTAPKTINGIDKGANSFFSRQRLPAFSF